MAPNTSEEVIVTRPSFWAIADDLAAYTETLSMVEAELDTAEKSIGAGPHDVALLIEQRDEVQASIERLGAELATKTDSIAGVLRRLDADAAMQREEADRMAAKAKASERAIEWLKAYTIRTMDEHGWKHLKTPRNTLAIRGNGGVQPLVIDAPDLIPDELCWMEGRIRADIYADLLNAYFESATPPCDLDIIQAQLNRVPSNTLIRGAMAGDCHQCDGNGVIEDDPDLEIAGGECKTCGGTGRATVPGAHLEQRGRHLRIS